MSSVIAQREQRSQKLRLVLVDVPDASRSCLICGYRWDFDPMVVDAVKVRQDGWPLLTFTIPCPECACPTPFQEAWIDGLSQALVEADYSSSPLQELA